MNSFCENPNCENAGFKVVRVSVRKAGDQVRTLCASCEEAYSIGVQHGTMTARALPDVKRVEKFLRRGGFLVLGRNRSDASPGVPFEAWAYEGPLDFGVARPMTFGVGSSIQEALEALESKLRRPEHNQSTARNQHKPQNRHSS